LPLAEDRKENLGRKKRDGKLVQKFKNGLKMEKWQVMTKRGREEKRRSQSH
jgi:hypothetical protein